MGKKLYGLLSKALASIVPFIPIVSPKSKMKKRLWGLEDLHKSYFWQSQAPFAYKSCQPANKAEGTDQKKGEMIETWPI